MAFSRAEFLALAALFLIRATAGVQFQAIAAVSPWLAPALGLDPSAFGTLVGLYMIPGIGLTVLGGLAAQRFGDRAVLRAALVAMAAGAGAGALADGFVFAAAARLLAGAGGTLVLMLTVKIAAEHFRSGIVATAVAVVLTSWPTGMGLGSLALTPFAEALGWRAGLAASGALALVALLLQPRPGARAAAPAPAGSPAPAAAGARRENAAIAAVALAWGAFNGMFVILAAFLVRLADATGLGAESLAAQTALLLWTSALMVPFGGWLADRFGWRDALILGGAGALALALAALLAAGPGFAVALAIGALTGLPAGPLAASLAPRVAPARRGVAFGWFSSTSALGIALGPPAAGALALATGSPWAPFQFALGLALLVIACALAMRLPALRPGERKPNLSTG